MLPGTNLLQNVIQTSKGADSLLKKKKNYIPLNYLGNKIQLMIYKKHRLLANLAKPILKIKRIRDVDQ